MSFELPCVTWIGLASVIVASLFAAHTRWFILRRRTKNKLPPETLDVSTREYFRTGVLLVQLGTPARPVKKTVDRFLRQFLNDGRVIDIKCPFLRGLLVCGIIVPFRASNSTGIYKELWKNSPECGGKSPLLFHTERVVAALNPMLADDNITVHMGMRYQYPSMVDVLEEMRQQNYDRIVIFPLFPQYASATNGSVLQRAFEVIQKWWVIPEIRTLGHFYDADFYLDTLVDQARRHDVGTFDAYVMSFHGLPVRHCDKAMPSGKSSDSCTKGVNWDSKFCYKAQCYATAAKLAKKLGITAYTVAFQSRLGGGWLEPYTDSIVEKFAKEGKRRILVFSPAFVADCLETTVEIGVEYQEIIEKHGGEKVQLVQSCNSESLWIHGLAEMIRRSAK